MEGIDEKSDLVQSKWGCSFPLAYNILMSQIVRHLLFASVLACHGVVTLCGPCLHALPGSSHELGATSRSHFPDDSAQSRRDAADNCLICQFVAQGQLPVEFSTVNSIQGVIELVVPVLPASDTPSLQLPSSPRAPPSTATTLS
jgi:hypothetical protein